MSEEYIIELDDGDYDEDEIFYGFIRINCTKLIRCKDCKRWGGILHFAYKNLRECVKSHYLTKPDDYCSYAERKEE